MRLSVRSPIKHAPITGKPTNLTVWFQDAVFGRERVLLVGRGVVFAKQVPVFRVHRLIKLIRLATDLAQTIG